MMDLLRVTFLRGTALGGVGNDANPGDVKEIPAPQARAYILCGRARLVPAAEKSEEQARKPKAKKAP